MYIYNICVMFARAVENKNYALFNYVNELNNQVELLQEQIDQVKTEIRQFEKQGIEMEEQRKRILKELEQKQRNAAQVAEDYEEKIKSNKKILDQSRIGIESLFKKINCDRSQIDILLLNKEGVTETNMSQYLGIIDSRTDELLKWQNIFAAKVVVHSKQRQQSNIIWFYDYNLFCFVYAFAEGQRADTREADQLHWRGRSAQARQALRAHPVDRVSTISQEKQQQQKYIYFFYTRQVYLFTFYYDEVK